MAKVIDENIQRQLDKKISFFVKYYPARIQNVGEDAKAARQLVWAFKDSRDSAYEEVAQMTAKHLKEEYGEKVKSMVLVCVPTSKKENYQSRYMMFCNRVSELTGIGNGFSHVCVLQDRLDVHNHRRGKKKTERQAQLIDLDTYYFKDKEICVFDDVVLSEYYYNGCFLKRNDFMLNHVAALLAYFDGMPKGGTFYTVRNAKRLRLQICNLF